jgi:IS605 OrfB family transposase
MNINYSYKVKLVNVNRCLNKTIKIYRQALAYVVDVVNTEWSNIIVIDKPKKQYNYMEKLIHNTKHNTASYDFDCKFYKFPSYLRRCVIADALGIVNSYRSSLENYKKERYETISSGKKFKKKAPTLNKNHFKCPTLYKGNMYEPLTNNKANIKIYNGSDWVWLTVNLRNQDIKYINKCKGTQMSPVLLKQNNKYYLQYCYEEKVKLKNTKLKEQKILATDLGLNHSAVCSLMHYDGTVTKRFFINQPVEKDQQKHYLNRLKLKQIQGGKYANNSRLWNKINNINDFIVNDTANQIIKLAVINNVDVIVLEYLEFKGKKLSNKAQQLHYWAVKKLQTKIEEKAHRVGIRLNRVNAKNTSKLAFDGSGKVNRDITNFSNCTFSTGKQYNSDLNASYNIGARYFIKEIQKTTSVSKWSQVVAKVPCLERRTQCTLSTLISLVAVL